MEGFGERAFSLLGPPAALSSARRVFSRTEFTGKVFISTPRTPDRRSQYMYYSGVFRAVAR